MSTEYRLSLEVESGQQVKPKSVYNWTLITQSSILLLFLCGLFLYFLGSDKASLIRTIPAIEFYFVPHSHDDLGWLITAQEYYQRNVDQILTSAVTHMMREPHARFSFTEMGFMRMWARDHPDLLDPARQLIKEGRLEILNAGLSVHDNACPYFDDIIANYEYGREFAVNTLGADPRIGWLIDPFGLSLTSSRLFAEMGYQEFVFTRITREEKDAYRLHGDLVQNWVFPDRPEYNLVMAVFPYHYEPPPSLNNENLSFGQSILDPAFCLDRIMASVLTESADYPVGYASSLVLIPFGNDFWFTNFTRTSTMISTIVHFVQSNTLTGRYAGLLSAKQSSVHDYFQAYNQRLSSEGRNETTMKLKNRGDFMPLIDREVAWSNHKSWTGYYTSNPYGKKSIISFGQLVRAIKSLITAKYLRSEILKEEISDLCNEMDWAHQLAGNNLHHDTITGTSKQRVAEDYIALNEKEITHLELILAKVLRTSPLQILYPRAENFLPSVPTTLIALAPICPIPTLRITVLTASANGRPSLIPESTASIQTITGCTPWGVCVHVLSLPCPVHPLPIRVDYSRDSQREYMDSPPGDVLARGVKVQGGRIIVLGIENADLGIGIYQYKSGEWNTRSSANQGKYVFSASSPATLIPLDPRPKYELAGDTLWLYCTAMQGQLKLAMMYSPKAPEESRLQVTLIVPPLPIPSLTNTNIVIRYFSSIDSGNRFITESNGLEIIERTYGHTGSDIEDANYYPVSRFIGIQDNTHRLSVITDRPAGGTSVESGVVEVMVNRVSTGDDYLGADEPVAEPHEVHVTHTIIIESLHNDRLLYRKHQVATDVPLIIYQPSSIPSTVSPESQTSALNEYLKLHLDIKSVDRIIIRLVNIHDTQSMQINPLAMARQLFPSARILGLESMSMDTIRTITALNRQSYRWNPKHFDEWTGDGQTVTLRPLDIRTYRLIL